MAFPFIAAIGGIVKGAGAVIKKVKVNGAAKVEKYNASIVAGESPAAKKGFLGMFTGKKKIQKAQAGAADVMAEQRAEDAKKTGEGVLTFLPWLLGGLAFLGLGFLIFGGKRK